MQKFNCALTDAVLVQFSLHELMLFNNPLIQYAVYRIQNSFSRRNWIVNNWGETWKFYGDKDTSFCCPNSET